MTKAVINLALPYVNSCLIYHKKWQWIATRSKVPAAEARQAPQSDPAAPRSCAAHWVRQHRLAASLTISWSWLSFRPVLHSVTCNLQMIYLPIWRTQSHCWIMDLIADASCIQPSVFIEIKVLYARHDGNN